MSSRVTFPPKLQGSTQNVTFDFISLLAVGETISTKTVTNTVYSGVDASPSAMISGSASSSGTIVTQAITAGVVGVIYYLTCTITTSASQTLVLTGFLTVIPNVT